MQEQAAVLSLVHHAKSEWYLIAQLLEVAGSALRVARREWTGFEPPELVEAIGQIDITEEELDANADMIAALAAEGVSLVTALDDEYPTNLRLIYNRPPFLFVRGDLPIRLWSPPGGLQADPVNESTGVVASGTHSVEVTRDGDEATMLVDGEERIALDGLEGGSSGALRYLRVGIDHYDAYPGAAVSVSHSDVAGGATATSRARAIQRSLALHSGWREESTSASYPRSRTALQSSAATLSRSRMR